MPKTIKQMQTPEQKERPESAIQFEEIYNDHHDPSKRLERRILDNRKQRAENIKRNVGL